MILVGEMRDEETVRTALSAAETGHLVLSTVHTVDAAETVNRIIDFFPQAEQRQARAMLAGTLKGVISQRLVPTPDGQGRVATCEVLRMTGRVRDMIMNPEETGKLPEVISEGAYYGMQTFDQALLGHVQKPAGSRWRTRSRPRPTRTTSSCSSPPTASARPRSSRCSPRPPWLSPAPRRASGARAGNRSGTVPRAAAAAECGARRAPRPRGANVARTPSRRLSSAIPLASSPREREPGVGLRLRAARDSSKNSVEARPRSPPKRGRRRCRAASRTRPPGRSLRGTSIREGHGGSGRPRRALERQLDADPLARAARASAPRAQRA